MTPLRMRRTLCLACGKEFEIDLVRNPSQPKLFLLSGPVNVSHYKGGNSEQVFGTKKMYEVRDGELVEVEPIESVPQ